MTTSDKSGGGSSGGNSGGSTTGGTMSDTTDGTLAEVQCASYPKGGFIPAWVLLIVIGVTVEFLGRLFGYEDNPTPIYHSWIPLGTAALSGVIVVIGYFTFFGTKAKLSMLRRRNGILLIVMGALMLATSFIFKSVIPLIFG